MERERSEYRVLFPFSANPAWNVLHLCLRAFTQGVVVIYYESIELNFEAVVSPYEVFGNFSISKLKRLSNALGLPHIGDFFRGFCDTGFRIKVPEEEFMIYEIKVNRVTAADMLLEANGCSTLYGMASKNNDRASNYYASLNTDADMTLSYIVSKLPPGYDIPAFLDRLEAQSEKIGPEVPIERTEGYCYSGIPKALIIVLWIMMRFTGRLKNNASPRFYNMLDGDICNPRVATLEIYAENVGSAFGSFVQAIEKKLLVLSFSRTPSHAVDNSKRAMLHRLLSASGSESVEEMLHSFPSGMRKSTRSFMISRTRAMQVNTLLHILSFMHLNLSDIII